MQNLKSFIQNSGFLPEEIELITRNFNQKRLEKHGFFVKEEPNLLLLVTLHYIVSMLGIRPRHLSRLRKKV
jgi:hypothetical protein